MTIYGQKMTIYGQNPDFDLTQEPLSLRKSRTSFVGHVTKLISTIKPCIFNQDRAENIICFKEQLQLFLRI